MLRFNPVGRVPTLELDHCTVSTESKLILDYVDACNAGAKLLPRDGSDGWRTLAEFGQPLGVLESATEEIARGAYQGSINAAEIALGTALDVAEHRLIV